MPKLDQYYTNERIANQCCRTLDSLYPHHDFCKDTFLEPSAGSGIFIDEIQNVFGDVKILAYDLEPKHPLVHAGDFLKSTPPYSDCITIGNPPYGHRSDMAIEFFNHAAKFSAVIAFILPIQFTKYSVHKKLDPDFKLIYSEPIDSYAFVLNRKEVDYNCVFQVWSKADERPDLRVTSPPAISHPDFEMFLYNNTESSRKYFDKATWGWDFAVPRQGYYDYALRISDEADLKANVQYLFFKSEDAEALDTLRNLDFQKLSLGNTKIPGFGKADVVKEYKTLIGD